ncbi:hypothetical protein ACLK2I_05405 [Escherichia coli]
MKVLKRDGDWLQLKSLVGRKVQDVSVYSPNSQVNASLLPRFVVMCSSSVKTLEKTTVADTNTEWSKLQAIAWMKKGDMVNDIKPIWAYAILVQRHL